MIPDSAMTNHQRYEYEVGLGHSTPVACLVSQGSTESGRIQHRLIFACSMIFTKSLHFCWRFFQSRIHTQYILRYFKGAMVFLTYAIASKFVVLLDSVPCLRLPKWPMENPQLKSSVFLIFSQFLIMNHHHHHSHHLYHHEGSKFATPSEQYVDQGNNINYISMRDQNLPTPYEQYVEIMSLRNLPRSI